MGRKLFPVEGENVHCGPAAIAAVTGKPLERILRLTGRHPMSALEMQDTMERLGFPCQRDLRLLNAQLERWRKKPVRTTLGGWLRQGYHQDGAAHIVFVTGHAVAVAGGEICDNGFMFSTIPQPVEFRATRSRKRLANEVWLRVPPDHPQPAPA